MQNYVRKKEQKERRENDLREGLRLYKYAPIILFFGHFNLLGIILLPWINVNRSGKYEEALEKFESVLGSKPELDEASVASYNVACCYSKLNQVMGSPEISACRL